MNILLPWNTSYCIPSNAFHPLYSGLLECSSGIRYIVPRRDLGRGQYQSLLARGVYHNSFLNKLWWLDSLPGNLQKKFYNFYSLREINYVGNLPGNVEFLHSTPITTGNRSFIFHCEAFLPIFMPFSFSGRVVDGGAFNALKKSYGDLFRSRCLAIVSHSKKTLDEISAFFGDSTIDSLLHHIDVGVTTRKIKKATFNPNNITFLFTSSAHKNPGNFLFRGGYVSIGMALRLLQTISNSNIRFIFVCKRPDNDLFVENDIDLALLQHAEEKGSIIWLETRIPQYQFDSLMAKADFLLMPSASLHSVSVITAMQYRTVPVVTDIPGYDIFLNNQCAVILDGVKDKICRHVEVGTSKIYVEDYKLYQKIQKDMVDVGVSRIAGLLEDGKIESIKDNLLKIYLDRFTASKFASEMELLFEKLCKQEQIFYKDQDILLDESYIEDLSSAWFGTCPQPQKLFDIVHGGVFQTFMDLLYVPLLKAHELNCLETFSLLSYAHKRFSFSGKDRIIIKKGLTELTQSVFSIEERRKGNFKYMLVSKLRRNERLFLIAKKVYRFIQRVGR